MRAAALLDETDATGPEDDAGAAAENNPTNSEFLFAEVSSEPLEAEATDMDADPNALPLDSTEADVMDMLGLDASSNANAPTGPSLASETTEAVSQSDDTAPASEDVAELGPDQDMASSYEDAEQAALGVVVAEDFDPETEVLELDIATEADSSAPAAVTVSDDAESGMAIVALDGTPVAELPVMASDLTVVVTDDAHMDEKERVMTSEGAWLSENEAQAALATANLHLKLL